MLRFFKGKKKSRDLLQNWQIPLDASYRIINNGDSIQFVNDDESRILYFSILTTTGDQVFSGEILAKMQPSLTQSENAWQFKGARQGSNEILICLFTFTDKVDEVQMRDLFANIVYIGR
ncbi:MAG: hypothetical protein JST42_20520 [Bacteroidetes bacterium]|nr:hypothetical protein [Bacteroidota bacterium]